MMISFFFSSRRRHTRCSRDWSSDVCSSDLQPELFANPVLIGAITVLVAAVGLLLAYNANNGLPFVPTYNIRAMVPDAAELTPGNEVRVGGKRVGVISRITAEPSPGGVPAAALS